MAGYATLIASKSLFLSLFASPVTGVPRSVSVRGDPFTTLNDSIQRVTDAF